MFDYHTDQAFCILLQYAALLHPQSFAYAIGVILVK